MFSEDARVMLEAQGISPLTRFYGARARVRESETSASAFEWSSK